MQAEERERARWARELHDGTLQGLGSVRLVLSAAREQRDLSLMGDAMDAAIEQLGEEIAQLRHLIVDLRPAELDEIGLEAALDRLATRTSARAGLPVHCHIDLAYERGDESRRLSEETETAVYRIVQEALHNVVKHAGATVVDVQVTERGGAVSVTVTDDGSGMRAADPGIGIAGMRERAALLGGTLRLDASPGGGTVVDLTAPARRREGP